CARHNYGFSLNWYFDVW
nr:immunoglobulin heavy chain junction region [Mus musculus]